MTPPTNGSSTARPASKPGEWNPVDHIDAISEKNRAAVLKVLRELRASGLEVKSTKNYFDALRSFDRIAKGKPLHRIRPGDVVEWVEGMRDEKMEETTIRLYKALLGASLKRSNGGGLSQEMEAVLHHAKRKKRLPADSLVNRDEVLAAAHAARVQRDRAMLLLGYEGAYRIGELHALNLGSVIFDGVGGADIVIPERNGSGGVKTGGRTVWVFDSVPDLRLWINMHPSRDSPDAPLWCGPDGKRLSLTWMRQTIEALFEKAGVQKPVWPHLLRHSRLTELAANIAESDLRVMAGWTPGSDQVVTYVNRTAADLKRKLKRLRGVATEEEKAKEDRNPLAPLRCPSLDCGVSNPAGSKYCNRCGSPLTAEVALQLKEAMTDRKETVARVIRSGKSPSLEELKEELRTRVLEDLRQELIETG